MIIPKQILNDEPEFKAIFEDLHANPEIGFEEFRTAGIVEENLRKYGVDNIYTKIAETGIIAFIEGRGLNARKIGLRADMDALPIQETTNLPYSSNNPGKMHACGHDGHTTMLLGAAKYLCQTRNFDGQVVLIFQPAEEGLGGARRMIEEISSKKFDIKCDEIYGFHNAPNLELKNFAICKGKAMAGACFFDILITGSGGHAARPHHSIDSLVIGASLVNQIQSIVSRNIPPLDSCVISVTKFNSGSAYNIIPNSTIISGTIRYFEENILEIASNRLNELCKGLEASYNVSVEVKIRNVFDVLYNDDDLAAEFAKVASKILGPKNVFDNHKPSTGSEDFADFLKIIPGAYCLIGHNGNNELHNSNFVLDPKILPIGSTLLSRIVEQRLPLK